MKKPLVVFLTVLLLAACAVSPKKAKVEEEPAVMEPPIFALIEQGKTREAMALITDQNSTKIRDSRGRTPLHVSAEKGNVELIRFLLAMGADPDPLNDAGESPLCNAAAAEKIEAVRLLVGAGADIHRPISAANPLTPAQVGVRAGGPMLDALLQPKAVRSKDTEGLTILHLASKVGRADAVKKIIDAMAPVNERDKSGKTPLDYALAEGGSEGFAETAEMLVLAGGASRDPFYAYFAPAARSANYDIRVTDGYAAIHYAAYKGFSGYISFIAGKKADVNIKNNSGATALHEAYKEGRLDIVSQLIGLGADVNEKDAKGNSTLHLAAPADKHEAAIALLLENNANPAVRDEHGETPLHVMIALGRSTKCAELLLEADSEVVKIRNIKGMTPLYMAVENKRADLIPMLLAAGSDIFAADNRSSDNTPLERAIIDNDPKVIDAIITKDTVLQKDSAGNTAIHIALRNKADMRVVELIVNLNGDIYARNKEGNTAIHIAAMVDHGAAGTLLLSRKAEIIFEPNSKGESPLYLAFHSPGAVREWMLTKATLEAKDGLGNTALHYVAQWKRASHVSLLVQKGAKVDAQNAMNETPLFMAARSNTPDVIQAMITAGASIQARDAQGNSPLHHAIFWDAQKSIDPLLSAGNNINAQNLAGKSPLHEAVRLGLSSSETALLNRKPNLEIRDIQGNTPLIEAIQSSNLQSAQSVDRLVRAGADVSSRNNTGDTPLHIAVSLQRIDVINILLGKGALIHARNSQGVTPFQMALSISPSMVAALLTRDRVAMSDDDGLSPLHIALEQRVPVQMVKAIIDRGGRVSAVNSSGRTPLRVALDMNNLEAAKLLADSGSDMFVQAADNKSPVSLALSNGENAVRALFAGNAVNVRDGTGNTALHYAAQVGNIEMIGLLLELGANKTIKNISLESPADIAYRWRHEEAAAMLQ
jgi:ankyrin repeat protein